MESWLHLKKKSDRRVRLNQLNMQRHVVRQVVTLVVEKHFQKEALEEWEEELVKTFQVCDW